MPHERLVKKLRSCGIAGNLLRWITNWLKNRRQQVRIKDKNSSWINVTSGVPQGSVLGPLLFVIYINDEDFGIKSKISKFADDTKLCAKVNNEINAEVLRLDLERIYKWSEDWQMFFNIDKCKVMHMGKKSRIFQYHLGNQELRSTEEEKDPGVMIHKNIEAMYCRSGQSKSNTWIYQKNGGQQREINNH